jgi:hypothetical protein
MIYLYSVDKQNQFSIKNIIVHLLISNTSVWITYSINTSFNSQFFLFINNFFLQIKLFYYDFNLRERNDLVEKSCTGRLVRKIEIRFKIIIFTFDQIQLTIQQKRQFIFVVFQVVNLLNILACKETTYWEDKI